MMAFAFSFCRLGAFPTDDAFPQIPIFPFRTRVVFGPFRRIQFQAFSFDFRGAFEVLNFKIFNLAPILKLDREI